MNSLPRTVGVVPKNNLQELRVGLVAPSGVSLVDVRLFNLPNSKHPEPTPTPSGFCLPANRLPALIKALQDAEREAAS